MTSKKTVELSPQVLRALQSGSVIQAIKLLRDSQGLGLKDAKQVVDAVRRAEPEKIATDAATRGISHSPNSAGSDDEPTVVRHPASGGVLGNLIRLAVIAGFLVVGYLAVSGGS